MKKTIKQILSALLVAVMLVGVIPLSASATQSRTGYFSKSYSYSSNPTDYIMNIAQAQIGRTKSQMGYTEAWCADFVGDCAKLAGQDNAIPLYGGCGGLLTKVLNAGGQKVSNRQKGDLVFYYCTVCGGYVHVGLVLDNTYSVEGNFGGKVTKVNGIYRDSNYHSTSSGTIVKVYVRPNYTGGSVTLPYNISISANTYSVGVGDTVTFNYSIAGATSKSIGIDRAGGSRYKTIVVSDDSGSVSYTFTEPGLYCCITEGKNAKGYNCCDGVYIRVIDTVPQNISISSNYSSVAVGDTVTFKYSITGATGKCIGIDHAGGSRYKTIGVSDDSGTVSYTFTEPSLYCCITEGYNSKGYNCCDGVYIRVIDTVPQNISISSNYSSVAVGDTVTFKYSITGATDKCIGIDHAGGSRYKTILVPDDSGTVSYSFTEPGLYCCITEGINAKGYNCCDGVYINVFDPNFSINFNANGGLCTTTSKKVTYGAPFGNLPIPTRSGYTFEGWYTNSVGGTKIKASDIVNNTTEFTLYAHWKANAYTISYNVNGGTGSIASQTKTHNTNLTLTMAKPTGKSFTVTYNANGGTVSTSSKTVSQSFTNWNTAANGSGTAYNAGATYSTNANVTLYAQYANLSIGSLPTPTRSGYSFEGWYTSATGGTKITNSTEVTANTTVYAHWKANAYTVSYNVNGGTGSIASQTKTHGTNLTLTTAKPTGKSFTVTYNANGGTVSTSSKTVSQIFTNWNTAANGSGKTYNAGAKYSANESVTLYAQYANPSIGSLPTPTRSGYSFEGWYTSATGGTKITDSTKVTANITIYAHWTKNSETKAVVKDVKINHNVTVNYKSTYMLSPEITADKGAKYTVKYESSDTKVATVDKDGKVYGAKKGTATITCTVTDSNGNTVQDTCKVTVKYSFGQWLIVILLFGWIWYI